MPAVSLPSVASGSTKMGFRILMGLNSIHKSCVSRLTSPNPCSKFVKISFTALDFDHLTNRSESGSFQIQRRWHVGHSQDHHDDRDSHSGKEGEKIFRLGLAADIGLAAGKAATGYLTGSTAIIADAAHSMSDVVLSGVALLSFKVARTPKDKEHPYGHGKFETLGALGISCMLLATAGGIAWHALYVLQEVWFTSPEIVHQSLAHKDAHSHQQSGHHHGMDHPILALNMAVVSIAVKEGLYWMTKRVGEKTGSGLMKANAWHHRADAVSSVIALIGVGGSILGVRILDPLAGLLVSGMILKAGLESGYQSIMELVDAAVPSQDLEPYKETIMGVQGVKGYNHLRGRRAGSSLYLDVDVEVDPFSSVSAAHDVGESVRCQIQHSHPEIAEVFIHIEPATSHLVEDVTNGQKNGELSNSESSAMSLQQGDVEDTVRKVLASSFLEEMEVQGITRHSLQGQIFLEIDVSMSPEMLIREAAKVAKEAEQGILDAVPNIAHISFRLQLGQPLKMSCC